MKQKLNQQLFKIGPHSFLSKVIVSCTSLINLLFDSFEYRMCYRCCSGDWRCWFDYDSDNNNNIMFIIFIIIIINVLGEEEHDYFYHDYT